MKAIVTGMIASYPVGGVLWDYGQYALGLERLGFEVYYLEDTGWQTYDPRNGEYGENCAYGVEFLKTSLAALSPTLGERWRFRAMDGTSHGLSDDAFAEVVHSADLFLNVSGGTLLRDEYLPCRRKVLIDSDPGWNHFRNFPRWDANPNWYGSHGYRAHDHFFTYAERLGQPGCTLPDMGLTWKPTRPPVVLDCWRSETLGAATVSAGQESGSLRTRVSQTERVASGARPQFDWDESNSGHHSSAFTSPAEKWTTVMTWKNFQETIEYKGATYGTKEMEFGKIEQLPQLTNARLELAIGGGQAPRARWRDIGWSVVDSQSVSQTMEDYRSYIQRSRGELSVAKNVYAATRCGWFSCRSVCYLAAGRPVVVQDTGFSEFIPTGEGLFAFSNQQEALKGIEQVEADYARHQQGAREAARRQFASDVVLSDLLTRIGL